MAFEDAGIVPGEAGMGRSLTRTKTIPDTEDGIPDRDTQIRSRDPRIPDRDGAIPYKTKGHPQSMNAIRAGRSPGPVRIPQP